LHAACRGVVAASEVVGEALARGQQSAPSSSFLEHLLHLQPKRPSTFLTSPPTTMQGSLPLRPKRGRGRAKIRDTRSITGTADFMNRFSEYQQNIPNLK
jgi:hypothetical protein